MKAIKIDNPYPLEDLTIVKDSVVPSLVVLPVFNADIIVKVNDTVKVGQVLARGDNYVHASISGVITAINHQLIPHPSDLTTLCITITNFDGIDKHVTYNKIDNYQNLSKSEILAKLCESGVVGLGGAGFTTHLKLNSLDNCDTIIINATECEPVSEADNALMLYYAKQIIYGIEILLYITDANKAIIAIEDKNIDSIKQITKANNNKNIIITAVPSIYTSGAERNLIKNLLSIDIANNKFPTDYGILCQNVATVKAIYDYIILGVPLTKRVVTITGDAIKPYNAEFRVGTLIKDVIKDAYNIRTNGLMMGIDLKNANYPILKTTNAVINNKLKAAKQASECIKCSQCVPVCPENLLPQQLYFFIKGNDIDKAVYYDVDHCILCRMCDEVCPSNIPLSKYFSYAMAVSKKNKVTKMQAEKSKNRFEFRKFRLERNKKEREIMMAKKREEAKIKLRNMQ